MSSPHLFPSVSAPVAAAVLVTINGEAVELVPPCSIAQLLEQRQMAGKRLAVERNGEIVPRSQHAATSIQAGDRLEIVVAVGGG